MVWQWLAARGFPLHQKTAADHFVPAVSILKPLKGCDETTEVSLQTWFRQNYSGPTEILFGVADAEDPVCEIVRRLIAENPAGRARLVVCENLAGANAKVAKLAQLERQAAHDLMLTSDADVRVPPDFLASFIGPIRDEEIALVNCFYRLANPTTTAMQWEAVAINADFWSQVLQALWSVLWLADTVLTGSFSCALPTAGFFLLLRLMLADDLQRRFTPGRTLVSPFWLVPLKDFMQATISVGNVRRIEHAQVGLAERKPGLH